MPIRKLTTALFIVTTAPLMAPLTVLADGDAIWQGSYEADGQCFCSGQIPDSMASKIVPTPIGGQTVSQVCAALGDGPGLSQVDGLFNHTVYKDMQCGHGPFLNSSSSQDVNCLGTNDGTYGSCQPAGPEWALGTVYSSPALIAAAKPDDSVSNDTQKGIAIDSSLAAESDVADALSANVDIAIVDNEAEQKLETASNDEFNDDLLSSFEGKSVTLGEDRYLQARENLSPNGGAPGSRIILDGLVYVKDDENLLLSELYTPAKSEAPTTPQVAENENTNVIENAAVVAPQAVKPAVEAAPVIAANAENVTQQKFIDAMQQARADAASEASEAELKEQQVKLAQQHKQLEAQRLARIRAEIKAEKQAEEQKQLAARKIEEQKKLALAEAKESQAAEQKVEKLADATETDIDASSRTDAVVEASKQVKNAVGETLSSGVAGVVSALRLPENARASSRNFNYFEAMPTSYDFGGAGFRLEGSMQRDSRFQFLGNLGMSDTYSEVMIGGGYYLTPKAASRLTVVLLAGVESGSFELTDEDTAPGVTVTTSDSGIYLGALSRVVINNKFELKGGLGYSSFFSGDATFFGGGYYHVTPRLDIMSRFEIGDNDHLGLGIRYYY